jgi:ArgJ family
MSSSPSARSSVTTSVQVGDTPTVLPEFNSREAYLEYMESVASLPKGFATGTADGTFVSVEAPGLGQLPIRGTVIHLTQGPTDSWAAVYTKNRVCVVQRFIGNQRPELFGSLQPVHQALLAGYIVSFCVCSLFLVVRCLQFPGAPVLVGKKRIQQGGPLQAIVINNKVSNVCSGGDGVADSERVCAAVAEALQLPGGADTVLPSSTGVIGWRLPATELATDVVPRAVANLQTVSALNAAQSICTTDRYPKVRSKTLSTGARLVGIAKGAGMIEPNLATMLVRWITSFDEQPVSAYLYSDIPMP